MTSLHSACIAPLVLWEVFQLFRWMKLLSVKSVLPVIEDTFGSPSAHVVQLTLAVFACSVVSIFVTGYDPVSYVLMVRFACVEL